MDQADGFWIFGYGSLMWSPGFSFEDVQMATLDGYHRDLCILSYVFRGTSQCPGLVMGLKPGGQCRGRAFFVKESNREKTLAYLHGREMINDVYAPDWVEVELGDGRRCKAYTFIAVLDHEQYVGHIGLAEKVKLVLQGRGIGGTSLEYLANTVDHLSELAISDPILEEILSAARTNKG